MSDCFDRGCNGCDACIGPEEPLACTTMATVADLDAIQTNAYAEGRNDEQAELASVLPGTYYMDPPDGGSVTVLEQLQRMAKDAARYRLVRRGQHWSVINGIGDTLTGAALDAAADAKLAAAAPPSPPPEEVELDAWECPDCGGHGKRTVYHKVTHQLGTDELPFWETCETCNGIGYCGPDAEKRAAIQAPGAAPGAAE